MSRAQASSRRTQPEDVGTHFQPRTTAMPRPPGLPSGQLAQSTASVNDTYVYNVSSSATADDSNDSDSSGSSPDPWSSSFLYPDLSGKGVTVTGERTTEDYSRLKEQFYQSYDPQVGVHTAAVLGGILGWLIVYLVYKTKIKKWVISLVKRKSNKRQQRQKEKEVCEVFAEFEDHDLNPDPYLFQCPPPHTKDLYVPQLMQQGLWQTEPVPHPSEPHPHLQDYRQIPTVERPPGDLISPSIVVDSYTSIPPAEGAGDPQAHSDQGCGSSSAKRARRKTGNSDKVKEKKKRYRRKRSQGRSRQFSGVTVVDVEEPDTKCLLPPPCSQADSARATARWVQNMPLLMRSQLDVNGLILQVQPHMLGSQKQSSCPLISNALHFAALPLLGLPSTGWNNSMPTLVDRTLGSPAGSGRSLVCGENRKLGLNDGDLRLLQPVPCCAARSRSSFSHPERSSMQGPLPQASPPLSLRSPSPRLTSFLPKQSQVSSSAANLAVPGSGMQAASSYSAPTSPVPIPVTPKVTILRKFSSRGSRVIPPHSLHHHPPDSEASISSSLSSFDPLTQLQPDCHCDHQPMLQQQQQQQQHQHQQHQQQQQQPDPSVALTSSRASWTVFDDDEDKVESGSGVEGRCGRGEEEEEEGEYSRQNSCRSNLSSSSLRQTGNTGRSDTQDTAWTLETKL